MVKILAVIFGVVALCSHVCVYNGLGGTCHLHFQSSKYSSGVGGLFSRTVEEPAKRNKTGQSESGWEGS